MDDHYIRFRFTSMMSRGRDSPFEVLANDMDEMNLFLTQHGFKNVDPSAFKFIPKEKCRRLDNILEIYKFKSNFSDEVYSVMTSEFFVNKAIDNCANDLNNTLLFGEAILRNDIEIFKEIEDILLYLPHVHIKDILIADDNLFEGYDVHKEMLDLRKQYFEKIDAPWQDYDSYLVNESLYDNINDEEIYPITIEGYVSSFASLITDTFNN